MLSRSEKQLITSLNIKKHRNQLNLFLLEGAKIVNEALISNVSIEQLFATGEWLSAHAYLADQRNVRYKEVTTKDIKRVSNLKSPPSVIALARIPVPDDAVLHSPKDWILGLEEIQQPSNLGAIIRTADWFGVSDILCSHTTADCYQPKVVQSSMGSLLRVNIRYTEFGNAEERLADMHKIATVMDGKPIPKTAGTPPGIIFLGNEGHGLSDETISMCDEKLSVPGGGNAESLNVAVTAGIFLFYMCARSFK